MSEPYSEQQVSLIINELTKQQYESITPEQYQLYLTPDTTDQDIADAVATHNTSDTAHADIRADIPDVIDNVLSTSTTDALSANQGKILQDEITHLQGIGRFLALWNATTGLAETNPPVSPYTYKTGDYFIVGTVGATNYKPSGSSYTTGVASTTVETATIEVGNVYYYDGTNWALQAGGGGGTITDVQVAGTSVVTGDVANITNMVTTNTAQDVSAIKTFKEQQKFQSGSANGCIVIGADATATTVTANVRKLGRMAFHTKGSTTLNCSFVSTDTQRGGDTSSDVNMVEFGSRTADTTTTAPDEITFTVAKVHNSTTQTDKLMLCQYDKNGVHFYGQPDYNGNPLATVTFVDWVD